MLPISSNEIKRMSLPKISKREEEFMPFLPLLNEMLCETPEEIIDDIVNSDIIDLWENTDLFDWVS